MASSPRGCPCAAAGRATSRRRGGSSRSFLSMSHHRETVDAAGAPAAVGPYSHAVRAGGLLFCSGQIPLDPDSGELVGDTAGDQARQCLENLSTVIEAGGAKIAD